MKSQYFGEIYDDSFFDYVDKLSIESARHVVPVVHRLLPKCESVLDVGCARGIWLRVWQDQGAATICGIDGDYVDHDALHITRETFVTHDLALPIDLGAQFDLVQSLEVAEHLPRSSAATFVGSLTRHGQIVFFSAAVPGQGGAHHINEQSYEYWRELFAERGYLMFDCVRPLIKSITGIQPWYRFNSFLFVHEAKLSDLTEDVLKTHLPIGMAIPDVSPLGFRLRRAVVANIPGPVQTIIASALSRWRART